MKKGALRNFAKFTGKHLCQRLFFNKVAGRRTWNLCHRFSCEFCEICENIYFNRTPQDDRFLTNMAKFNISVQSFRPNSKNVFRHPSTPSLPFRDFMKNLLYRQICPNSCPFLLKTLYCSKASGCCCYISPHGMNVETTCLSLIVVAGCSKKIQHAFICNNMH